MKSSSYVNVYPKRDWKFHMIVYVVFLKATQSVPELCSKGFFSLSNVVVGSECISEE